MNYRDYTLKDIEMQKKLLSAYRRELSTMPAGHLLINKKGKYIDNYQVIDNQRNYIRKENVELVEALKRKRFLDCASSRMEQNIIAQSQLMKLYKPYEYGDVINSLPEPFRNDLPADKQFRETKPYGNQRLHQTLCGLKVRSKSEAMFVESLCLRNIDFEYEKELRLYGTDGREYTVHPDFTFCSRTGQFIYHEHFGMLGDERYRKDTLWKCELYIANGIIPSVNLLITAENFDGALDMNVIDATLDYLERLL